MAPGGEGPTVRTGAGNLIVYDTAFNQNEFFILLAFTLGVIGAIKLKRIFTKQETALFSLLPVFIGLILDHSISVPPFDFYDVNDTSAYEPADFLTYLTYGPYGYFYFYFLERWKVKNRMAPLYILAWAVLSLTIEYIAHVMGVFHYKNGYRIFYSFPIYLMVLPLKYFFYRVIRGNRERQPAILRDK